MCEFDSECRELFCQMDNYKLMVLSTSLNDKVTSRMMSIVIIENKFYFQTDVTFRKYEQIQRNPNAALCADNIQIEGICREIGRPQDNAEFCELYSKHFSASYELYSRLKNERLFAVSPTYIQRWIYEEGRPFVEIFDFQNKVYDKKAYVIK